MAFAELEHMSLIDYVEKQRTHASTWAFLHLAKTAGTSLTESFNLRAQPSYSLYLTNYDLSIEEIDKGKFAMIANFANEQNSRSEADRYKVCCGHLRYRHLKFLCASIPDLRKFTFIRDPVERVISDYRYRRTPAYWGYETFCRQFPRISDFASKPGVIDIMSKSLINISDKSEQEIISAILNYYEFIGVSENYSFSASALFRMMNIIHRPVDRLNETITTDRNNFEIESEERELIKALNPVDMLLYEQVQHILTPHIPRWEAYFEELQSSVDGDNAFVDLASSERWRIHNGNQWIATRAPGLRLHPNDGNQPPASLQLADVLMPGRYRFDAQVLVFDSRCRAHRLEISLSSGCSPNRWSLSLDGERKGRVGWRQDMIEVNEASDVRLAIVMDDPLAKSDYSATELVRAAFTRL